jgi:hypothetical protein
LTDNFIDLPPALSAHLGRLSLYEGTAESKGLAEQRRAKAVAIIMLANGTFGQLPMPWDKDNAGLIRDGRGRLNVFLQNPERGAETCLVNNYVVILLKRARARGGASASRHGQHGWRIDRGPKSQQTAKDRAPSEEAGRLQE